MSWYKIKEDTKNDTNLGENVLIYRSTVCTVQVHYKRVIKGATMIAEMKRMLSRGKHQTEKTDTNKKEHETSKSN